MENYDLLQTNTRIRRLVSSSVVAIVVAGVSAPFLWKVIDPPSGLTLGPWKAFVSFLLVGAAIAFAITHWLLKRRDDKSWYEPAKATMRAEKDSNSTSQSTREKS